MISSFRVCVRFDVIIYYYKVELGDLYMYIYYTHLYLFFNPYTETLNDERGRRIVFTLARDRHRFFCLHQDKYIHTHDDVNTTSEYYHNDLTKNSNCRF